MHAIGDEINEIDRDIAASPDLLGAECSGCFRLLAYKFFRKDSSLRTGHKPLCMDCEDQPKLSIAEHTARMKEKNFNSVAVKAQRHEDQNEFRKTDARRGRPMHTSELLIRLQKLVPSLFIKDGGLINHLALYQIADQPQAKWDGRNYKYLGYVEVATLPEFSTYSFDDVRDVMIREEERGWRTVLLRFIRAGLLTEEQCIKEFGHATGQGSAVWAKELWKIRNTKVLETSTN